jgi:hypothetical protein
MYCNFLITDTPFYKAGNAPADPTVHSQNPCQRRAQPEVKICLLLSALCLASLRIAHTTLFHNHKKLLHFRFQARSNSRLRFQIEIPDPGALANDGE